MPRGTMKTTPNRLTLCGFARDTTLTDIFIYATERLLELPLGQSMSLSK